MSKTIAQEPSTRDRLIDAAVTGIVTYGWSGLSTRRVAQLAEVNPGVVHYHFDSMDALRHEALATALQRALSGPVEALLGADAVAAGVEACMDEVDRIDPTAPESLLLVEAMVAATRDEQVRELIRLALREFRAVVADQLRAAGAPRPDAAAALLAAAIDGIVLHRLADPDLDGSALTAPLLAALELPEDSARTAKARSRTRRSP